MVNYVSSLTNGYIFKPLLREYTHKKAPLDFHVMQGKLKILNHLL